MDKFWKFKNTASPGVVELLLYGEIKSEKSWWDDWFGGSGIYADAFVKDLQEMGNVSQITCRINSPGGDIFAAVAIYTQLKTNSARVVAIVDGIAASAATFPLMAADEIQMCNGAMVMIHDPLAGLMGMYKADELTKHAQTLLTIKESIVSIYAERTKTSKADLLQMMSDETWMSADDAIKNGFCDKKIGGEIKVEMKGKVAFVNGINHDISGFKNLTALEHAQNITAAIAAANEGGSFVAQFVAMAAKGASSADPDGDGDGAGGDGDGDGDGSESKKTKNKTKNKSKDEQEEIDDGDADDDAGEEGKDKKEQKAKNAVQALINKYPNITNRIIAQAKSEERLRLQEIDAISNKVSPALLNKAKYEDCTTAKDLAFEQMKASSANSAAKASNYMAAFTADTQASGVKDIGSDPNGFADVQPDQERVNLGTLIAGAANKILGR